MSLANREMILARVAALLSQIDGFEQHYRNRGDVDQLMRPCTVLLDGDETTRTSGDRRGRVKMSPAIVTMRPQVFILLKTKQPKNDNVGQDLNAYRELVLAKLATDAELLTLIGPNGDLAYEGAETDLKTGNRIEGQMRLDLAITTTLNPYN